MWITDAEGPGLTAAWVRGGGEWLGSSSAGKDWGSWLTAGKNMGQLRAVPVGKATSMLSCVNRSTMAKRLSPFTQHSLEHSWNAAPTFGPYNTRKTSINWSEFGGGPPWWSELGHLPFKEILRDQGVFSLGKGWLWWNLAAVPTNQY